MENKGVPYIRVSDLMLIQMGSKQSNVCGTVTGWKHWLPVQCLCVVSCLDFHFAGQVNGLEQTHWQRTTAALHAEACHLEIWCLACF